MQIYSTKQDRPDEYATKQVFLVDDNTDDIALTRRALARVGFPVYLEALKTADAFIRLFESGQQHPVPPDLVLIDLNLPTLSGFELLRWIRKNPATMRTPVVMISSVKDDEDVMRSYDLGASSFIQKSIDFTEYAHLLKEVCAYWINHNVLPSNSFYQAS